MTKQVTVDSENLKKEQSKTLSSDTLPSNFLLRTLIFFLDLIYGKERTLFKFKVIELLARYPYIAWENRAYQWISALGIKCSKNQGKIDHALHLIDLGRDAQDNEQWHFLIIEDMMEQKGLPRKGLLGFFIPHFLAFNYRIITRLIFLIRPQWSFSMNARFESHAEHQYMLIVQEHPEWEEEKIDTRYFE